MGIALRELELPERNAVIHFKNLVIFLSVLNSETQQSRTVLFFVTANLCSLSYFLLDGKAL